MSTSDPHRPGGATDRPDETAETDTTSEPSTSIDETTPAVDDSDAHQVAPTVETLDPPTPTEPEIREAISGNLCRCTGYDAIVDAVASCASRSTEGAPEGQS